MIEVGARCDGQPVRAPRRLARRRDTLRALDADVLALQEAVVDDDGDTAAELPRASAMPDTAGNPGGR